MPRPVYGVLILSLRHTLAVWRLDSPLQRVTRVALLMVVTALNCGLALTLGFALSRQHSTAEVRTLASGVVLAIAAAWIVPSVLFGTRFTADLPLPKLVHLPVTFRGLYAARIIVAFAGPWLALFLPPLIAVMWAAGSGPAHGIAAVLGVALFVLCLAELTSMLSIAVERWTSSWGAMVAGVVLVSGALWIYFAAATIGRAQAVSAAGRVLRAWGGTTETLFAAMPTGLFVSAISTAGRPRVMSLAGLAIWAAALIVVSYRVTLWRVLAHPQPTARRIAGAPALGALLSWTERPALRRFGPQAAVVAQALLGYVRISNVRVMILIGTPYCVAFPLFMGGNDHIEVFFLPMLWVPLMFFISLKANVLGADPSAVRAGFWYPIAPHALIRAKLTALNVIASGLALAMLITLLISSRHLDPVRAVWSAVTFWLSQLALTDALGATSSVLAPKPVTWGRAAPSGNDPQIAVASMATGGFSFAVGFLAAIARVTHVPWVVPAVLTVVMMLLVATRHIVLGRTLPRLLDERRDAVLAALPLGA